MQPSNIQDDHHFVKQCKQKELIRENGTPIGIHPAAFKLRPPTPKFPQEKTISGVYYEFFDGSAGEKLCACYHFIQLEIKPKDALVRMRTGLIKEQGKKRSRTLRVRHEPFAECKAYSALHGLPVDADEELCALLAAVAVVEITSAGSVI